MSTDIGRSVFASCHRTIWFFSIWVKRVHRHDLVAEWMWMWIVQFFFSSSSSSFVDDSSPKSAFYIFLRGEKYVTYGKKVFYKIESLERSLRSYTLKSNNQQARQPRERNIHFCWNKVLCYAHRANTGRAPCEASDNTNAFSYRFNELLGWYHNRTSALCFEKHFLY